MIALVMWVVAAWAATVNANLCAEYQVEFTDVNGYGQIDDNYFTSESNRPARGAFLRIVASDTPNQFTTHQLSDSNPACVTVPLNDNKTYTVKLVSQAEISGKELVVRTSDGQAPEPGDGRTPNALYAAVLLGPGWTPVANPGTLTTGLHRAWTIAAVAGWAVHREDFGTPNTTITFYDEACTEPNSSPPTYAAYSCANNTGHEIRMLPSNDKKVVIAHELAHVLFTLCDDDLRPEMDKDAAMGSCDDTYGTGRVKAYSSYAAIEGIAWFYAAYTFNEPSAPSYSCAIAKRDDYNQNCTGSNGSTCMSPLVDANAWDLTPSCGGIAEEANRGTPESDYLGNMCSGTLDDRSTRIDWWRTWWDLVKYTPMTASDVCDIWDGANPHDWDADGGSAANDPFMRLYLSAHYAGFGAVFASYGTTNGVHR